MAPDIFDRAMHNGHWLALGGAGIAGVSAAVLAARAARHHDGHAQDRPKIVILGAGFAGLTTARELRNRLGERGHILMIDRHNYHLFTPLLFQVAALGITPYDIAYPVRQFTGRHAVFFQRASVTGIDFDGQHVQLSDGEVDYDYLVIALGATTNFFGNKSAMEHAFPLKSLEDGMALRNHVVDAFEQAATEADIETRQRLLTFVVVGGGATGVETAAALADVLRHTAPVDYPTIDPNESRVILIHSHNKLLGHMGDEMANAALERLRSLGVEIWFNTKAKEVAPDEVTTDDNRNIRARTVIWTTGVRCPDVVASLGVPHGKAGSIAVDQYLQAQGKPGVFAVGDNAHFEDPTTHHSPPLLAAAAVQEGSAVAENLVRAIEGKPQVPFHYRSLGNAVSLGRGAGAAEVGGMVATGVAGGLAWRMIHLAKISSFRNRLATALDWSMGYVYDQDTARLEMQPETASSGGAQMYG